MGKPINPPPAYGGREGDLPAYVSNGLIGLRVREQPLTAGMAIVSGVAGVHPERRLEAAVPSPYPLAADVSLNGVWLSDQPWTISDLVQSYDFEAGELRSAFIFAVQKQRLDVEVLTFASRTAPSLVLQLLTIHVAKACEIKVRALVETDGLRGSLARRQVDTPGEETAACDGSLLWQTEGGVSTCGIALHTSLEGGNNVERTIARWDETGSLTTSYQMQAEAKTTIRLYQIAALIPSLAHQRPDEEAVRRVARGYKTGFTVLRQRNRDAWANIWQGRIVVHGASSDHQALIDAAFFYLNSSVHAASVAATSIFGLATWHDYHYYYGHVMWDIEAFCVPSLALLQPDAALAILDFRMRGLEAARRNARLSVRRGLQFPWEAAPMSGEEAAPGDGSAAAHEDHVSLHVARAFALYADITGDEAFLMENAWPVLSGVADWIVSRATETARGMEILSANGPAEVPDPPDNDAFTNMAAGQILRRAIRAAEQTGREVPATWVRVAEALYIPRRSDGVIATHDGYRVDEPKGATPSVLAGFFPYDHPSAEEERQRTLAFFLPLWPKYVGSPMLPALYGVWAAMAGDRDLALQLFEEGYAAYDHPRFHQCLEYRPDHADSLVKAGPFFANLGGMLLGLLFGYTGLIIDDGDPEDWPRRPILLPTGWEAIEIERLWIRGKPTHLIARQGEDRAELTVLKDAMGRT